MIWFGWGFCHINHCRLFNAKSSLYRVTKYIGFGFVEFYGLSTFEGYLMPNPVDKYISNIYDLEIPFSRCPHGVMVKSDGLRNRSKRVCTSVALLCSLSGKYLWKRYEPPYPPSYGLNSTATVLL